MILWVLLLTVVCGCPSKPTTAPTGGGSQQPPVTTATTCDDVRPKIEALYRAESATTAADNTTMVLSDCNKDPARIVPCLANAQSVPELEKNCLIQLDDEGTEGDNR
jgi:hypothetical protein